MGEYLSGSIYVSLSNNLKGNLETGEVYYFQGTFLKDEEKKDCFYLHVFEIG